MKIRVLCLCAALGVLGCASSKVDPKACLAVPVDQSASPVLKGRVTDTAGKSIAGAEITLHAGVATRWPVASAKTNAKGKYTFDPCRYGSLIFDRENKKWDYFIGMTVSAPGFKAADGQSWWDIRVPQVDRHVTKKDFVMVPSR
jgi:hypothetical protein